MVCGLHKAIVVDVDTMDKLKAFNINTADNARSHVPLISAHMIPGTDYKFMLEFVDSQFVYLVNVETKEKQILI